MSKKEAVSKSYILNSVSALMGLAGVLLVVVPMFLGGSFILIVLGFVLLAAGVAVRAVNVRCPFCHHIVADCGGQCPYCGNILA